MVGKVVGFLVLAWLVGFISLGVVRIVLYVQGREHPDFPWHRQPSVDTSWDKEHP